ncbi:hypothetical protein [Halomicrobium sp. LC1Hm]|nr:hypothetical protein [Halomicrobium sp. LC1Hm]
MTTDRCLALVCWRDTVLALVSDGALLVVGFDVSTPVPIAEHSVRGTAWL